MSKKNTFAESLQRHIGSDRLIEVDRSPLTKQNMVGFVAQSSQDLVALNVVDDNYFLNGFSIIRIDDIKRYRIVDEREAMVHYILSQRYPGGFLKNIGFDLGGLQDFLFLGKIHEHYPLVTLFREAMDETVCSIGKVESLKPKTLLLHTIDIDATWDNIQRFRYEDITRIDFGGKYEEALWIYASFLSQQKSSK